MITDKFTLQLYLDADRFALERTNDHSFFKDDIWRYEIYLRKYEYAKNTHKKLLRYYYAYKLNKLGTKLGFYMSGNTIGPGLRINHYGLLLTSAKCKIGKWCDLHQGVQIASNCHYNEKNELIVDVPTIENYTFIAPGVKIFGDVKIGNNVRISANTVVTKDIPDNSLVFGNPMVIKDAKSKLATIASQEYEEKFLQLYPQYREYLENYK